eukprot:4085588-Pleurochrysis_carterae.AAC.1
MKLREESADRYGEVSLLWYRKSRDDVNNNMDFTLKQLQSHLDFLKRGESGQQTSGSPSASTAARVELPTDRATVKEMHVIASDRQAAGAAPHARTRSSHVGEVPIKEDAQVAAGGVLRDVRRRSEDDGGVPPRPSRKAWCCSYPLP